MIILVYPETDSQVCSILPEASMRSERKYNIHSTHTVQWILVPDSCSQFLKPKSNSQDHRAVAFKFRNELRWEAHVGGAEPGTAQPYHRPFFSSWRYRLHNFLKLFIQIAANKVGKKCIFINGHFLGPRVTSIAKKQNRKRKFCSKHNKIISRSNKLYKLLGNRGINNILILFINTVY